MLVEHVDEAKLALMKDVHDKIKRGAKAFLFKEYIFCLVFTLVFALIIFFLAEVKDNTFWTFWTTVSFLVGAFTSIASGYIGMMIAVNANVRTTKECAFSLQRGFRLAYQAGSVLGFVLVGLCLLLLVLIIIIYKALYISEQNKF